MNLSGLSAGCRLNSTGQNPNRGFTNGAEVEPSVEGKVLLNYEALLKKTQPDTVCSVVTRIFFASRRISTPLNILPVQAILA
uniref:Peptidase n=1 Tax=Klebsiella pneumoniae TaxID=573 RepID=A0A8B0STZ0_KLEPN|nr:peptidase [Klebsiella pneumoniae]